MWSMIKQGYEGLVMTVIRPMRATYATEELGPSRLLIGDVVTERQDLQLKNPAGYTLECSWWQPKSSSTSTTDTQDDSKRPCIVVLHGNSSCRLGSLEIVAFAIPAGFSVFALDFSGSGLSEGKYVSLGYHEQSDIATVVQYLRSSGAVSKICLWGRSMGAVATLLYAQQDPEISALVLDSPFSSLPQLAVELVEEGKLGVPKVAVKLVMRLIRRDIKRRAKFDMFKLKPIDKISKCTTPAFFVVGAQDELVGPHHVEALYKQHNGPKQLFQFPGGHNSPRPLNCFIEGLQFLRVMIGLLPLSLDAFDVDVTTVGSPRRSSASPRASKKATVPVKVFKNPLPPGVSAAEVPQMSVKQLKEAIASVGFGEVSCLEKKDLVELVLKLHARHLRSKEAAQLYSGDDLDLPSKSQQSKRTSSTSKDNHATSPSSRSNSQRGATPVLSRRHSDDTVPAATNGAPSQSKDAVPPRANHDAKKSSTGPFPVDKVSSASVIPDIELTRELSGNVVLSDEEREEGP
ncbi:hypothetical protein ATCC90586_008077 [Pythium insidiosum]|nr:hypothetical protein ATCC90586_008077 [Pythium insidiosum]